MQQTKSTKASHIQRYCNNFIFNRSNISNNITLKYVILDLVKYKINNAYLRGYFKLIRIVLYYKNVKPQINL